MNARSWQALVSLELALREAQERQRRRERLQELEARADRELASLEQELASWSARADTLRRSLDVTLERLESKRQRPQGSALAPYPCTYSEAQARASSEGSAE